jgi:putative salt-induced outer membrane protein YdiY
MSSRPARVPGSLSILALLCASPLLAQDAPELGLQNVAELTVVMTSGNATSRTFGVANTTTYRWPASSIQFGIGGVRAESGVTTRTATGTPDDFEIVKETDTEKTAENYFARARYDRTLGPAFLFGGAGWTRNTFAGIQNRYAMVAGVGRAWSDTEESRFKADVGVTYTIQKDVVEVPDADDSFVGARATVDFFCTLTPTTTYGSLLVVDENFDETDDLRADWTNSVAVAISDNLALKASYQMLFDNLPALTGVPLGADEVLVPLEKTDGTVTIAVVVDF